MGATDDFDDVRRDPDPVRRGRRATELLAVYQQRAAELARLRRVAVEDAHRELGLSYTQIAAAMGLTKGRVSQIRGTAPPPERAFFGTGPVSVGVPLRHGVTDRQRPLVAAEDMQAGEEAARLLEGYALAVTRYQIGPGTASAPPGDAVVICGPKTAPVGAALLARDQALDMREDGGRWWIVQRATGQRLGSPTDEPDPTPADLAYVGRHQDGGHVTVHIAGIHAIGSLGAVHYLTGHLAELFAGAGDASLSLVTLASYDGLEITGSSLAAGPFTW
ncbi:MAG TPA: hypothetical protein VH478_05935 [Trebonia sp.]|nr:hypothetical protein [Trebonia sp.]